MQADPAAATTSGGPRLTVLSGPSGVGKSTVVLELREQHPRGLAVGVGDHPDPRPGESDGVHYYFVDDAASTGWSPTAGCSSGPSSPGTATARPARPVQDRLAAGTPVLLEIELQGARQVRAAMPDAVWSSWPRRAGTSWCAGSPAGAPRPQDVIDRRLEHGARRAGRRAGVRRDPGQHDCRGAVARLLGLTRCGLSTRPRHAHCSPKNHCTSTLSTTGRPPVSGTVAAPEGITNPPIDELLEATDSKYAW